MTAAQRTAIRKLVALGIKPNYAGYFSNEKVSGNVYDTGNIRIFLFQQYNDFTIRTEDDFNKFKKAYLGDNNV